jgi:protoporphyrinogen oxidase
MKTIIIGAGLSGLSLAYYLEKKGDKEYILLESSHQVGGLSKSTRKEGFTFDFGPHNLHFIHPEIAELVKELLGEELVLNNRKAGILLKGKVIPYPFQYNLYHLDEEIKAECLKGVLEAQNNFKNRQPQNFDEWVKMSLGEGIAKWFMTPYNKKCFCVNTKELTLDFLGRHVPNPSFEEIKQGAFSDMSNTKKGYYYQFYSSKKGGIDILPISLAKKINNVNLEEKVIKINLDKKIVFTNKSAYSYTNLVSTIPITKLVELIENIPEKIKIAAQKIRFNVVCAIILGINRPKISNYHFLYLPQEDILPYRISFPMNTSEKMTPPGMSSICAEYSYLGDKDLTNEEIIETTIKNLIRIGIIKGKEEVVFKELIEINPAYVIFDSFRRDNLKVINDYLCEIGINSIGPFGKCEHLSMEESIFGGKEMAEKIT